MAKRGFLTATLTVVCVALGTATSSWAMARLGECPQPRSTSKAPTEYLERTNPLAATPQHLSAGEQLYLGTPKREFCAICHGGNGDGIGPLANQYEPPPRNFSCAKTMSGVPDGQLFWVIRFGSPDTAMPPHPKLSDEQVWQLVLHLRRLAK
jgi:mono/diheme cytochrome c family protein